MKRKPINRYSLKKIAELNAEVPIRYQLIARCQGIPHPYKEYTYNNGKRYSINRVSCLGGYCECGLPECGHRWATHDKPLHPHEKLSRGQGGKLSMENSVMVMDECHAKLQNNVVKWGKP